MSAEDVANFASISGATNFEQIRAFLERFEGNLEMAVESFFEVRQMRW